MAIGHGLLFLQFRAPEVSTSWLPRYCRNYRKSFQKNVMNPIQPFLEKYGVVILDGALATELERRGADLDDDLWSAKILPENPELIKQVNAEYLAAGADVIVSASYQATLEGFRKKGLSRAEAAELLAFSVQIACEARDEFWSKKENRTGRLRPLVAASIGPYGAFLADGSEYRGDYDLGIESLKAFHRPRFEILAKAGADLLAFETIPCLREGIAIIELLDEFPGTYAWLSFSCRDEKHLSNGELFSQAAALASRSGQVVATGVNCVAPRFVENLLREGASATGKPLMACPNSGEHWDAANHCWLPGDGKPRFEAVAEKWYAAGARLIGGCCRTTPEDIKSLNFLRKIS
jgi:homocysteine S-methyltransferase